MKRNMDLVREILLKIEEHQHGHAPDYFQIDGFTGEEVGYHCYLLEGAGLINAADDTSAGSPSPSAIPISLTWEGHEFIANAKNDSIWGQAKDSVNKIGEVSFSVWASVLTEVVKSNLGLNS